MNFTDAMCHALAESLSYAEKKGREEKEKEFALRLAEKDFQMQEIWNQAIEESVKVAKGYSCMNCVKKKPCVCPEEIALQLEKLKRN